MKTYDPDRIKYLLAELQRFLAENEHWNDTDVAHWTGISKETLKSWLLGKRKPWRTSANLEALEKFLQERRYAE